ncbi:unnamed protein product [Allacma fusca]|uniref:Uncharacterized protein n=1 Tax=Allacma fusca TaxID=39272 RepID=A0A8J2KG22_9HEXA|nr:unnamed protein product [Allacma fusca]
MEINSVSFFNETDASTNDWFREFSLRIFLQSLGRSVKEWQTLYSQNNSAIYSTSNDVNQIEITPTIPLNESDLNSGLTAILFVFSIFLLVVFLGCRIGFCFMDNKQNHRNRLAMLKLAAGTRAFKFDFFQCGLNLYSNLKYHTNSTYFFVDFQSSFDNIKIL